MYRADFLHATIFITNVESIVITSGFLHGTIQACTPANTLSRSVSKLHTITIGIITVLPWYY